MIEYRSVASQVNRQRGVFAMKPSRKSDSSAPRSPQASSVRDRLLDMAADLFYREGGRAVGVDLVVERTGVAKTSLYRHFPTKDPVAAAVYERDAQNSWPYWDLIAQRLPLDPKAELVAHVQWIAQYIGRPEFRGCGFLKADTEVPFAA